MCLSVKLVCVLTCYISYVLVEKWKGVDLKAQRQTAICNPILSRAHWQMNFYGPNSHVRLCVPTSNQSNCILDSISFRFPFLNRLIFHQSHNHCDTQWTTQKWQKCYSQRDVPVRIECTAKMRFPNESLLQWKLRGVGIDRERERGRGATEKDIHRRENMSGARSHPADKLTIGSIPRYFWTVVCFSQAQGIALNVLRGEKYFKSIIIN